MNGSFGNILLHIFRHFEITWSQLIVWWNLRVCIIQINRLVHEILLESILTGFLRSHSILDLIFSDQNVFDGSGAVLSIFAPTLGRVLLKKTWLIAIGVLYKLKFIHKLHFLFERIIVQQTVGFEFRNHHWRPIFNACLCNWFDLVYLLVHNLLSLQIVQVLLVLIRIIPLVISQWLTNFRFIIRISWIGLIFNFMDRIHSIRAWLISLLEPRRVVHLSRCRKALFYNNNVLFFDQSVKAF